MSDETKERISLGVLILTGLLAVAATVCVAAHMRGVCASADAVLEVRR